MQTNTVSVKELNKVLSNEKWSGTFSDVDIVFVAGLFLQYMQHREKIPLSFNLTENDNAWNHSHYFQQIFDLYDVKHNDIFENFPNAYNATANSFSRHFVPPIYITPKSIDYFFGIKESNSRIDKLKEKYQSHFDISDFVDTRFKTYTINEQKFKEYTKEIQQRLKTVPPIFTFIFIVACKRLAKKENRTFEKTKDYIEKIWLFTQTYVSGLHELARNIVEHSGKGDNNGQGMITIRAYSGISNDNEKIKVLETHVFDYGEKGIYETLKQNTAKNSTGEENDIYVRDLEILTDSENKYTISDFIESIDSQKLLSQQFRREMAHYGLMYFKNLIEQYEGKIIASSIREDNKNRREEYVFPENIITTEEKEGCNISKGTSYYFEMPFIPASFEEKSRNETESSNQQTVSSLSNFQNVQLVEYAEIDNLQQDENKKYLINIKVSDFQNKISTRAIENSVCENIICKLNSPRIAELGNSVALDFDDVILNKSNLLRILARLSREVLSNYIVYNIHSDTFIGMIKDNEQWFEKVKEKWNYIDNQKIDTSYWFKDKSILFFTRYEKIKGIEGEQHKDYFYFADFLYGNNPKTFNSINKIVSNTFPNVTYINKEEKEFETDDNFLIPQKLQDNYFYGNSKYLLPFDTLLKSIDNNTKKKKELFLFNITTIIQNKLFGRDTYYNIADYVNNYEGYHISDTHFKIGNKVHSSDFYYAKRLFQNSQYTTRLAMSLAKKINDSLKKDTKPITLVGYEMYSELILSLIEKFLIEIYIHKDVNHFVSQNEDDKWDFLSKDTFNNYLKEYDKRETIIIVPIAATGSTSRKIENEIRNRIYKKVKDGKEENEKKAEREKNEYKFFNSPYNIILAQDLRPEFADIRKTESAIINIPAVWYNLKNCPLCFGINDNNEEVKTKPLFDTDNSSLTPSLIFGNPKGKTKSKGEIENSIVNFNGLKFQGTIEYQSVARNDNYRTYDVDSDKFINANKENIIKWLKHIKNYLERNLDNKLKQTDNIVIVAPCHESNSQFLNLINENVFSSSATIIHHQKDVDFVENFRLLNENYLKGKNTKIFFVDDALITGKHFFEIFDLLREVTDKPEPLTASIFINDQAVPFIHDRAVRWSKNYFAFATFNQPPTLNILDNPTLEYERKRYMLLHESTLHDTLRQHFHKKTNKLNPNKRNEKEEIPEEKRIRRLKTFEATHKIYDYFKEKKTEVPNLVELSKNNKLNEFVEFKLEQNIKKLEENEERDTNTKALFKVLSQYPFILYKNLREETFNWHKQELSKLTIPDNNPFVIKNDYDNFSTFKFFLRRATFLGNYQVLEVDFLKKLLMWFIKIDKYFDQNKKIELDEKEENLRDFPIFVLGNYAEMIQKNGWVAVTLIKNIKQLDNQFLQQGLRLSKQFYRMLQIESAVVIDDYVKMIEKEHYYKWRDMYKYTFETKNKDAEQRIPNHNFVTHTLYIEDFFRENYEKVIYKINKYEIAKYFVKEEIFTLVQLKNFLWIKQVIFNDTSNTKTNSLKKFDYQTKINAILEKMGELFNNKNLHPFFIVTDSEQTPYVLYDEKNVLHSLEEEYRSNSEIIKKIESKDESITDIECSQLDTLKFSAIFKFLYGTPDVQNISAASIIEYERKGDSINWEDCYHNNNQIKIKFLSDNNYLLLIRLSTLGDDEKFVTSGMLGFYGQELLYNKPESILPKQLLMLLRRDMNKFIDKHHKNDEFAKLREEEIKNRYAYLAGHGRQTMQRLAKKEHKLFGEVVSTMEKLQYLFATKYVASSGNSRRTKDKLSEELLRSFVGKNVTREDLSELIEMSKKIYDTSIIENKVDINEISKNIHEFDNEFQFAFNKEIFAFICFELIVNAKKNRYHFLDNCQCSVCNINLNKIKIHFEVKGDKLIISITNTGTFIPERIQNKVNGGEPVKDDMESAGLYLITKVIKMFNDKNNLSLDSVVYKDCCKIYENTVVVELNSMNHGK